MLDQQITDTFIGREFGWDRVSETDLELLKQSRESMMHVIKYPHQFPLADFTKAEQMVREIDDYCHRHGELLVHFA